MTESGAAAMRGRAPRRAGPDLHGRSGLIDRGELVAALDRAAEHQVTIVSTPAGSGKTSLLRAWADRPDQPRHVAFMTVRPGQQDSQLFWLMLLGTVRAAAATADEAEPPPPAPVFNGPAMGDKVLAELGAAAGPMALVIDDLHELDLAEALREWKATSGRYIRESNSLFFASNSAAVSTPASRSSASFFNCSIGSGAPAAAG